MGSDSLHWPRGIRIGPYSFFDRRPSPRALWGKTRPLPLPEDAHLWRTWPGFSGVVKSLLTEEAWRGRRNKVIALRQALRDGPEAVVRFRRTD